MSGPISRILFPAKRSGDHLSTASITRRLLRSTRGYERAAREDEKTHPLLLLDLALDGVCLASPVTWAAGGLLHRRFTLTPASNAYWSVMLSVALSVESPRLGVTQHRTL